MRVSVWFAALLLLGLVLLSAWVTSSSDRKPAMLRRAVWLWCLTVLFAGAVRVALFLREMGHPALGGDPAKFLARQNAELRQMLAVEAAIYLAACILVIWRVKKS
jgi:uncharacterized membrane protein YqjE